MIYNRYYQYLFLILLVVAASCTDTENKKAGIPDTLSLNQDEIQDTLLQQVSHDNTIYSTWKDFYEDKYGEIDVRNFEKGDVSKTEFMAREANADKNFYDRYGKTLLYNADSTEYIDMYSYAYIIEPNKAEQLEARRGGPDFEVSIVNPKDNTRKRILFCGTTCSVQRAEWINDHMIALYGLTSENGDEMYTPVIWFVNTANNTTATYYYNESSDLDADAYLEKYLNEKNIGLMD